MEAGTVFNKDKKGAKNAELYYGTGSGDHEFPVYFI